MGRIHGPKVYAGRRPRVPCEATRAFAVAAVDGTVPPVKFFDAGQEATGFIAVGQFATCFFALGQVATGVIAIGQVARGIVAIGQASFGLFTVGMLSAGLIRCVAMLGVAGIDGKGLVYAFVPKLAAKVRYPEATTLDAIGRSGEAGWVPVEAMTKGDEPMLATEGGGLVPIVPVVGLRQAVRRLANHPLPQGLAFVARASDGRFVAERLVRRRAPLELEKPSAMLIPVGLVLLVAASYAFWELYLVPFLELLLSSKA